MENLSGVEQVSFWRSRELGEIEWLHARYLTHRFARHWHDGYALGVIVAGAETFFSGGIRHCAMSGSVAMLNPGEIHDGEAAHPRGWRYRMLYPDVAVLERAASEIAGRPVAAPLFRQTIVRDDEAAALLVAAHRAAEQSPSTLERETLLRDALALLIRRYGDLGPAAPAAGDSARLRGVRDLIEARLDEDLSLETLAAEAGMSCWHFLRVFRRETGATPHLYLLQRRLARARALLAAGETPAAVASAPGFTDQSHLTHRFRRTYGVTPARFRQAAHKSKKLQD
ncbi:MAG TPA: AraC family transcriptional regulator [Stellaceae bacterium]|nr:AraC family transcriptional regulator [Stellaceae bacterium]